METLEAIRKRASLKERLSGREVEAEKIIKILDAARLAPSGRNRQPWRFIVVKGKAAVENLVAKAFADGNQSVKAAPVVIVACCNPSDDAIIHGRDYYPFHVALAVENMILAATDLGLVTHLITGVDEGKLKNILGIPDEVRFVVATPLAYPAGDSYDEAAQERLGQRTRKDFSEFVYSDTWGKPF